LTPIKFYVHIIDSWRIISVENHDFLHFKALNRGVS
jgi:hypothetical protein